MSAPGWICTTALDSSFPYSMNSLYVGKSRGLYPWLERRGRYLWIDTEAFNTWAEQRGIRFRFQIAAEAGNTEGLEQH